MGAGSAKGIRKNPDEEGNDDEDFSSSSDPWEDEEEENSKNSKKENNNKIIKADVNHPLAGSSNDPDSDSRMDVEKKEEAKRKGIFAFARKKDDQVKVGDIVDELSNSGEKKENEKKRFKIFTWQKNRTEGDGGEPDGKDEKIDDDINELEKTFDTLGIVGQNKWGSENKTKIDDIENLEPMRNRKPLKPKVSRQVNGVVSDTESSSSGKRTFRYSWEVNEAAPTHEDEWQYQAVVIEGFDIDKFKRANMNDALVFENNIANSLPNTVKPVDPFIENNDDRGGSRTPLKYDATEQQILASIERDFSL